MADPNLFDLPPEQRLRRFRELAAEAQAFATHMLISAGLRDGYLRIARSWTELADNLTEILDVDPDKDPTHILWNLILEDWLMILARSGPRSIEDQRRMTGTLNLVEEVVC